MILIIIFTQEEFDKFKKRDPEIFKKIYCEYKKAVYNFIIIKTNGNTEITDDIFSETFHDAFVHAPKLKNGGNIQSWLIKIANRRFYDYLRKLYRHKNYIRQEAGKDHYTRCSIDEEIDKKEKAYILKKALERINPKYSEILKMKYYENMPRKEIAEKLDTSLSSVENNLFRAREALKKELKKIVRDS